MSTEGDRLELVGKSDVPIDHASNRNGHHLWRATIVETDTLEGQSRSAGETLAELSGLDPKSLESLSPTSVSTLLSSLEEGRSAIAQLAIQRRALDDLRIDAQTDYLTGMGNRRRIERRLAAEWGRAHRHGRPLTVLMVDIDGLKVINDSRGHAAGDAVIAEVARRIADAVRLEDEVARIGGDEFMIVCPETNARSARAIARKLHTAVATRPFEFEGRAVALSVSVGWASTPVPPNSPDALVAAADDRLYRAKRRRPHDPVVKA